MRQLGLFQGFLSAEMKSTLHHILGITQDSTDLPDEVINKLRAHIQEERNVICDLVAFDVRKQKLDESFNGFLVMLKQITQDAGLDDCQKCYTQQLSPFPKLMKVVGICKVEETAAKDREALSTPCHANRVKHKHNGKDHNKQAAPKGTPPEKKCHNCGQ